MVSVKGRGGGSVKRTLANILPCMRDWAAKHQPKPDPEPTLNQQGKPVKSPLVYTPASALDKRAIAAIAPGRVTYIPGIATKRFARQIQGAEQLTDAQRLYVWGIVWKFRRQIKDAALVAEAKRIGLANKAGGAA